MNNYSKVPKIAVIILNWNGWKDTVECLESLYKINYPNYQIIIVDNASGDESIKYIKDYCNGELRVDSKFFRYDPTNKPIGILEFSEREYNGIKLEKIDSFFNKKIIIIKNRENYGFTRGNNIGIEFAMENLDPAYVLLLNNDTVVENTFLDELIEVAENNPQVGFVGPKIYLYEYNQKTNIIQFAGAKQNIWRFLPGPIGSEEEDIGQYEENKEVDFVHGSCMLVKTEMIKDIGLLDEEFFTYREENDWCMRGKKQGWISMYAYKSLIWHKGGKSTKSKEIKPLTWYYMQRNRFLFMKKHANSLQKTSFLLYFFIFDVPLYIGASILYFKDIKLLKCFLRAIKDGIILLK